MSEALLHMEHKVSMQDPPSSLFLLRGCSTVEMGVHSSSEPAFRNTLFSFLHFVHAFEFQHVDLTMED